MKDTVAETQKIERMVIQSGGLSARAVQQKMRIPKCRLDVLASWVQGWNSRIVFDEKKRGPSEGSPEHVARVAILSAQAKRWGKAFIEEQAVKLHGDRQGAKYNRRLKEIIRESAASVGIL